MNMNLYIWRIVCGATDRYHDDGGIAVIAESIERARAMIEETCPNSCEALTTEPDVIIKCEGPELIEVFPDAGCC